MYFSPAIIKEGIFTFFFLPSKLKEVNERNEDEIVKFVEIPTPLRVRLQFGNTGSPFSLCVSVACYVFLLEKKSWLGHFTF